jgi:hypothetical protein
MFDESGAPDGDRPTEQGTESGPSAFIKAAFKWQYNLIGLAGATAFAVLSGTALPLILAAGVELIYLSVIPHNKRFQRLVRSWEYAEAKKLHNVKINDMFQQLPPEVRLRYARLDKVCKAVRANYGVLSSTSQMLVSQMGERLQGILEAYLRLLYADEQHTDYLRTTNLDAIKREIGQLQQNLASESPKVQEINQQRIGILTKRLGKFETIRENRKVIEAQCAAIEDVLQLIRDQSVTLRDPQQVSGQLDSLVQNVEQTEETVKQVEHIFAAAAQNESDTLAPMPSEIVNAHTAPGAARRVRN